MGVLSKSENVLLFISKNSETNMNEMEISILNFSIWARIPTQFTLGKKPHSCTHTYIAYISDLNHVILGEKKIGKSCLKLFFFFPSICVPSSSYPAS